MSTFIQNKNHTKACVKTNHYCDVKMSKGHNKVFK